MTECELEKRRDGVALITLNRPDRLNALGGDLPRLLAVHVADCEADPAVRCLALTGAGRAFCAGGDVRNMKRRADGEMDSSGTPPNGIANLGEQVRMLKSGQRALALKLHTMAKPTVALVNGYAVGAGFGIALACDLRLAGTGARFGMAFRNVGLSSDYGGTYFLPRLVGDGTARELYFSGEVFDAERARTLGIVNRVYPQNELMKRGLEFCTQLAAGPTRAFAGMKDDLDFAATHTLEEALDHEALIQRIASMTDDHAEAVRAFVAKRAPEFRGR